MGNLQTINSSFAGTVVGSVSRNAAGQFTQLSYGNGVTNSRTYNSGLQLSTLSVSGPGGSYLTQTYNYNAGVSNNGRIVSISDNLDSTKSVSYNYDELNRLKTAATSGSYWGLSWTYDRYGNRLSQSVTQGSAPSNSLSVDASSNRVVGWTYDAAGNALNDGRNTYSYDAENRVISINGGATTYSYDAFGGRVQKTTGATTIRYYFGLAENTNGSWTKLFVGTAAGVIEWDNGAMLYKSNDHHGDTRVITNSSGALGGRLDMYPYGEIWSETGTTSKYKNTGKERDQESGNDYFGARYYGNGAGRWLGADPVLTDMFNPKHLNRYSYCFNDPINYTDPDGRLPIIVTICIGGICDPYPLPPMPNYPPLDLLPHPLRILETLEELYYRNAEKRQREGEAISKAEGGFFTAHQPRGIPAFFVGFHAGFGEFATEHGWWANRWLFKMHRQLAPFESLDNPLTPKNSLWAFYVYQIERGAPDICVAQAYFKAHNHDLRVGLEEAALDLPLSLIFEPVSTGVGLGLTAAAFAAEDSIDASIKLAGTDCKK